MEDSVNHSSIRAVYFADLSRWTGIWSLLPYLLLGILYYLETRGDVPGEFIEVVFVFVVACLLCGALLGSIALITGILAFRQLNNSGSTETGRRFAITGIALGLLGILTNVLFCNFMYFVALPLLYRD